MFRLMISHDLGVHYHKHGEYPTIDDAATVAEALPEAGLRWHVKDELGKIVEYCDAFDQVLSQMRRESSKHMGPIAFATEDKVLTELLLEMGICVLEYDAAIKEVKKGTKVQPADCAAKEIKGFLNS